MIWKATLNQASLSMVSDTICLTKNTLFILFFAKKKSNKSSSLLDIRNNHAALHRQNAQKVLHSPSVNDIGTICSQLH